MCWFFPLLYLKLKDKSSVKVYDKMSKERNVCHYFWFPLIHWDGDFCLAAQKNYPPCVLENKPKTMMLLCSVSMWLYSQVESCVSSLVGRIRDLSQLAAF